MNNRNKIAADLHHSADYPREWMRKLDPKLGTAHNILHEMMRVTGCFDNHSSANLPMLFHRIADLIDPTCYLEYREWIPDSGDEGDLEWEWCCSNCHHDLMEHYDDLDVKTYEELGLLYCPHCGTRIVGTRFKKDNDNER